MTFEEYWEKHQQYVKKQEYYKKKLAMLEEKYFDEMNKDNKWLKKMREELKNG